MIIYRMVFMMMIIDGRVTGIQSDSYTFWPLARIHHPLSPIIMMMMMMMKMKMTMIWW